ncbi:MAG: hydrogenase nickel incorporation protein HypA [Verrucomicrobia bacterium]|nr:hydrogenase nickel incorporation protein HypA [Verrucomicrobiota bacterium]
MALQVVALVYCLILAALFLGIWLYYDHRDHARFEIERRKTTFRCARCGKLYAAQGVLDLGTCPHCGQENARLQF